MFLDKILLTTREVVAEQEKNEPLVKLQEKISLLPLTRSLSKALRKNNPPILIAEIKKASPSKGVLKESFNPLEIAKIYEDNGASVLSVLTEEKYFQGSLIYLEEIKKVVSLPLLRKDFIVTEYQVYQARAFGADAILLIAAALEKEEITNLLQLAHHLNLECLVEVHNQEELEKVLDTPGKIIGINNRNLHSFQTDIKTTFNLIPFIPEDKLIVSESGIRTREEAERLAVAGVKGILVGESLVTSSNMAQKVQELVGWQSL